MKHLFCAVVALLACFFVCGCNTANKVTESASGKNLNLDGYLMLGEVETANPETATPQGKIIIGRATYQSRKVGIPADHKVPTTGYFKATQTEGLFGTKEIIIQYDFTAGSDEDAKKALEALKAKEEAAKKQFEKEEKKKTGNDTEKSATAAKTP